MTLLAAHAVSLKEVRDHENNFIAWAIKFHSDNIYVAFDPESLCGKANYKEVLRFLRSQGVRNPEISLDTVYITDEQLAILFYLRYS